MFEIKIIIKNITWRKNMGIETVRIPESVCTHLAPEGLNTNLPREFNVEKLNENKGRIKKSFVKKVGELIKKIVNHMPGVFLDLLFLPLLISMTPAALFNNDPKSLPKGTKKVTLCVHGFLHNKSAWEVIKPSLNHSSEAGPVFSLNLGHPFQSIEDYTRYVQEKIAEIKEMAGNEELEINLVGHSMGGLVCANYAVKYAAEDKVRVAKLITIASPLQGTNTARIARLFCKCAEEMLPSSEFIKKLNEKMATKEFQTIPCYHIGFGGDVIVPKSKTFFADRKKNDLEIPYLGHASALLAPSVGLFVQNAIQA